MAEQNDIKSPDSIELTSDYANNTFFEPSVWDLKIMFGEFTGKTSSVEWHTAITMPWAQAKLMAYYLAVNIAIHEFNQGITKIPPSVVPAAPPSLPESEKGNPIAEAVYDYVVKLHAKFLAELDKTPSV